jgi:sec-independent protein translocase protein TatA
VFGMGTQEWVVILIIVLVLFGATRVPQLMRSVGQGIKEFKGAIKDADPEPKPVSGSGSKQDEDKPVA